MPGNVREIVKESASRRKIKRQRFWLIGGSVVMVGLLSGLVYFLQQPMWQVRAINLEPDLLPYKTEIEKTVNQELTGRFYYILPKNSVLLVSKRDLAKKISAANPQLTFVTVSLAGQTLIIGGENRHPTALLCNFVNNCFYVDQRGVIYESGPMAAYYVLPIFQSEFSTVRLPQIFLPPADYQNLLDIIERLNKTVARLNFTNTRYRSINLDGDDVIINFRSGNASSTAWQLKFTTGVSGETLEKYLETLAGVRGFKEQLGNQPLNLIDLRFKPKVYYRFK